MHPTPTQSVRCSAGNSSKKKLHSHDSLDSTTIHEAAERGSSKDIAR
jgi:hypothetical protein